VPQSPITCTAGGDVTLITEAYCKGARILGSGLLHGVCKRTGFLDRAFMHLCMPVAYHLWLFHQPGYSNHMYQRLLLPLYIYTSNNLLMLMVQPDAAYTMLAYHCLHNYVPAQPSHPTNHPTTTHAARYCLQTIYCMLQCVAMPAPKPAPCTTAMSK
jgi:hypothetical protein